MNLQRINTPELEAPVGPYVHAVSHGDTLYTSGFTAFGTSAQQRSISEQAEAIFAQLDQVAENLGSSLAQLIKVTIFVTDLSDIEALRNTLIRIYGTDLPASSLIKIDRLFAPDLKIEIEAIFALD